MRVVIVFFLLLSTFLYALPAAINKEIAKSGISKRDISIYIKEAGKNGKVIASLNELKTRTPASVVKVLTTYSALLKFGFDYRIETKFYADGSISDGVLHGDLVIKGYGDPTLGDDDLEKISEQIQAEGIEEIRGNIIIDRSFFKVGNRDSSGFDQNPYSPYNAMPDAMMFNERVSTVCVTPKKNSVYKKSADPSYKVVNQLQRVNKPCKGRYSWPSVKIDNSQIIPEFILKGKISKRCGKREVCRVVTKPYNSFYYALKDQLRKDGVNVGGTLQLKKVPQGAEEIFSYASDSMEKITSKTNKKSNNLYARHLLLYLGAREYGTPATLQKGRDATTRILRANGALGKGDLRIDNGSGLSRVSRMDAKLLADVLDHAYDRYGQRWMNTLSIAGIDGTIKRRFRHTAVQKRAWMKTGTLKRVKNIGGYVKNKAGKYYTVVILINSSKAKYRGTKLQNEIMKWLAGSRVQASREAVQPKAKPVSDVQMKTSQKSTQKSTSNVKESPKKSVKQGSGRYYIQVGVFSRVPDKKYFKKIRDAGFTYTIKKGKMVRVFVGRYPSRKSASAALKEARKKINSDAFVVKL